MTRIVQGRRPHHCHQCGATIRAGDYCGQIGRVFECAACCEIDRRSGDVLHKG